MTPHLGAATAEAQENVALQIAEQMADYLTTGAIANALNMALGQRRGGAASEALHGARRAARQLRRPADRDRPARRHASPTPARSRGSTPTPLTATLLRGLLAPLLASVNMVNAPLRRARARHRGQHDPSGADRRLPDADPAHGRDRARPARRRRHAVPRALGRASSRSTASRSRPSSAPHMLYVRNADRPGLIGALGTAARRRRRQHRDLPPRPRAAGRRRDRADRGRPAGAAAAARRDPRPAPRRAVQGAALLSGAVAGVGPVRP